ncbi:hypothetical protein KP79_PYT26097 [Mizuhopecten yessoensis]|uniref:Uncharacterized protein n=1 Tax=Mizuhopecten yessoensis TaxID=6573 RepID=A0A210PF64_MIZYE|nr:hypothetical protein KP79_PYT26097 [Mizuhopecten yessoensis]
MVLEPKALRRPCKPLYPMWKVERLADPTHLGKAQFMKSNSAKFSESMFPAQTRQMRAHSQKKIPGPESPEQSDLQGPDPADDEMLVLELLKMKLGTNTVQSMRLNTSTQQNEGCHQTLNVSLPKYQNFGRNAEGRLDNTI